MTKQMTKSIFTLILALVVALPAISMAKRPANGNSVRGKILAYYAARGWTQDIRVVSVRPSRSGKSLQVLVQNNKGDKRLRAFNVREHVYRTPTGLVAKASATTKANWSFHRERRPSSWRHASKAKGTFSGVDVSSLSKSGNIVLRSRTDRNEVLIVNPETGKATKYETAPWLRK